MTEPASHRARVEELQRRRAQSSRSGGEGQPAGTGRSTGARREGAAQRSKIAAAGFGFAAMLGLVAALGYANRETSSSAQPLITTPATPAQVVVVIHPADATDAATVVGGTSEAVPASPGQPIVLSAEPAVRQASVAQAPTVRQAPVSQAPTGQTNGSR